MKYTQKSFSVSSPGSKSYADNWERTFRPAESGEVRIFASSTAADTHYPPDPEPIFCPPSEPLCGTCGRLAEDGPSSPAHPEFCSNTFHLCLPDKQ